MDSITAALPPNPKQAYGDKKPSLGLVPSAGVIYEALAFEAGAIKYGPYNWREKGVEAMTYVNAALRHLYSWLDGECNDPETGGHHLGHARACMGILLDCMETGNLIDNRPKAGCAGPLLDELKPTKAALVEKLKAAGFGIAEEPYPEGCEKCKGWTFGECHKAHYTGEICSHKCEYSNAPSESSVYADGFEAGATQAMKAAGRGDERLTKFCAVHKRWMEEHQFCGDCFPTVGSSR